MLQNSPFYWGSVRKIVESFGAVFSDLHIIRVDTNGDPYQTIEVPCVYGPKEKWVVRNTQNPMPGNDDSVEMVLPRMSYEITGGRYDNLRKLTSTGRTVQALVNDNTVLKTQYNPVPYIFSFTLHIMAKTVEDGLMIIEQILPFFTPDYTISVNDMPELDLEKDLVITYDGSIQMEDTYDGNFQDRRTITWTLGFTLKGYLYPPVKIKKVNLRTDIRYRVDNGSVIDGNLVPSIATIPNPSNIDAPNVDRTLDIRSDTTVIVVATPLMATLSGGQSITFVLSIVNATDPTFTATVPTSSQTNSDTYSTDSVHNTFRYTAGTGLRTVPETLTITFVSNEDYKQNASVTLTLNP